MMPSRTSSASSSASSMASACSMSSSSACCSHTHMNSLPSSLSAYLLSERLSSSLSSSTSALRLAAAPVSFSPPSSEPGPSGSDWWARSSLILAHFFFQGATYFGPLRWSSPLLWSWHSFVTSSSDAGWSSKPMRPPTSKRPSALILRTATFKCSWYWRSCRMMILVPSVFLLSRTTTSNCPATVGNSGPLYFCRWLVHCCFLTTIS
mmetsp:Transcript_72322/g.188653  ORF Transcript_72322/g.188653 Transcript_72322/m.188653 type:complete len:207 (-) Transcript_72322:333-953(-)